MSYIDSFNEIVSIMHKDYSGCEVKKGWDDPQRYRDKLVQLKTNGDLDDQKYYEIVQDYLMAFEDQHIKFKHTKEASTNKSIGFRVEYYVNCLYVISVESEDRLSPGMKIVAIDGTPICEEHSIRRNWESRLERAVTITIEKQNETYSDMNVRLYDQPQVSSNYTYNSIDGNIGILTINNFMDKEQMESLLKTHEDSIATIQSLIIDIRENRGGMDAVYEPLLKYIFPQETTIRLDSTYHLITERNYKNRMKLFEELQKQYGEDEGITLFIENMEKYKGKGFVPFDFDVNERTIHGMKNPENIILLIDRFCGSSGDQFALTAAQSPKVSLLGRPTKGTLDYSNLAKQSFESIGFELWYPTSISSRVEKGEGIDNVGVQPDHYITWTPQHLSEDVDLNSALEFVRQFQSS